MHLLCMCIYFCTFLRLFPTLDFMTFRRGVSESGDKQEAINPTLSPTVVFTENCAQTNTQIYSAMQILLCKLSLKFCLSSLRCFYWAFRKKDECKSLVV